MLAIRVMTWPPARIDQAEVALLGDAFQDELRKAGIIMRETSRTIANWGEDTFGPALPEALVARAATELAELAESLASADADAITSEAADVAILLHRLAHLHGWDLTEAVDAKMARNRARIWERSGDGTGRHLTEAPEASANRGE
jgi:NTP pyrophosphatase (non-canonical NTP hydrolase)